MKFNLLATSAWRRESAVKAELPEAQKTIFLIEDDAESLHTLRMAVAGETYRVETACSAESAIRRLSAAPPALILLNTQVLAADGTPLARRLLGDGRLVSIPIFALTETSSGERRDSEPAGRFDRHIGKPVNPETFAGEVRSFLESFPPAPPAQSSGRLLPENPTGDAWRQVAELLDAIEAGLPDSQFCANTRPSLQRLAEAMAELPHPEVTGYLQQAERLANAATARGRSRFQSVIQHCRELVDRASDATPGLTELCAGYLDRRRAELSTLERWLKEGDFAALRKAGHNLKGTGAAYGFGELTTIGRALEAAAKEADATAVEDLLTQFDSYIGIVRPSPE